MCISSSGEHSTASETGIAEPGVDSGRFLVDAENDDDERHLQSVCDSLNPSEGDPVSILSHLMRRFLFFSSFK